jgi:endonuclease VIII
MAGRFFRFQGDAPRARPSVRLRLATEPVTIDLVGPPTCELISENERLAILARLGPDPLRKDADPDLAWFALAKRPRRPIGDALLDQRVVAGIGNVWKAEALWEARVSPWRRVSETSDDEARAILGAAHELMRGAVEEPPERRAVYRRAGHGCRRCGTPIESRGQGEQNRTAYWCPKCQS